MRMNDGRSFTDYRPKCISNYEIINNLSHQNITNSSYESRMFLQKNAENIMKKMQSDAEQNVKCGECKDNSGILHPERYVVKCNTVSCQREEADQFGFGDGRLY